MLTSSHVIDQLSSHAFILALAVVTVTSQSLLRPADVTVPGGKQWISVDICLELPVNGTTCGWKATVKSTVEISDVHVLPTAIRVSSLNQNFENTSQTPIYEQSTDYPLDTGSGQDSGSGQDLGSGSGHGSGNGQDNGSGYGSGSGNGQDAGSGQDNGSGQNTGSGQDNYTPNNSSSNAHLLTWRAESILLESDMPDTCFTFKALKNETHSVKLRASIHCVCLYG